MSKTVFAIAAHPDDIEFMMAGTLCLLGRCGYAPHVLNLANGSGGSQSLPPADIALLRGEEARAAAAVLGATWHEPLVDDLQIYYTPNCWPAWA